MKKSLIKYLSFIFFLFLIGIQELPAQNITTIDVIEEIKKLEQEVKNWGIKYGHPGAEILVTDSINNVIYHTSFGKVEKGQKFLLGSATKPFTYGIVLILISEGKINFSTKVRDYIPEVDPNVTVEMLLSHESGYSNSNEVDEWFHGNNFEEILDQFISGGMTGVTGYHKYAEDNSFMLAKIVEIETGIPYYEAWQEKIGKPLNLKNTYGELPNNYFNNNPFYLFKQDNFVQVNFLEWRNSEGVKFIHPSAGLFTTSLDYAKFLNEFKSLVNPEVFHKATHQQNNKEYGYGFNVIDEVGLYGHTGATGFAGFSNGAYTFIYWSPAIREGSRWRRLLVESSLFTQKPQVELKYFKEQLPLEKNMEFLELEPDCFGVFKTFSNYSEYDGEVFNISKDGKLLKRENNGRIIDYWGRVDQNRFIRIHRNKKMYYPANIIYWRNGTFEIFSKESPLAQEIKLLEAIKK